MKAFLFLISVFFFGCNESVEKDQCYMDKKGEIRLKTIKKTDRKGQWLVRFRDPSMKKKWRGDRTHKVFEDNLLGQYKKTNCPDWR